MCRLEQLGVVETIVPSSVTASYSTADVEDIWRTQWRGKLFFAHGSKHSCGVMILV